MGDLGNLRPFAPGTSGNPGGRRRTRHVTELLVEELARPYGKQRDRRRDQALAARLVDIALRGRRGEALRAMALILSYVDGLPVARVETGEAGAFEQGFEIRLLHVTEPPPLDG